MSIRKAQAINRTIWLPKKVLLYCFWHIFFKTEGVLIIKKQYNYQAVVLLISLDL